MILKQASFLVNNGINLTVDKAYPRRPRGPLSLTRARQSGRKKQTGWSGRRGLLTFFSLHEFKREGNFFLKEEEHSEPSTKNPDPNLEL